MRPIPLVTLVLKWGFSPSARLTAMMPKRTRDASAISEQDPAVDEEMVLATERDAKKQPTTVIQMDGDGSLNAASQTTRATRSLTKRRSVGEEFYGDGDSLGLSGQGSQIVGREGRRVVKRLCVATEVVEGRGASKGGQASSINTKIKTKREDQDEAHTDPESGLDPSEDLVDVKRDAARPPAVNSEYLPLPWKGRLGYACLNTYLRTSAPPVFTSRTCRIASIIAHRHPLQDESQPEHQTHNRPDKTAPADVERGRRFVEQLGLANVGDVPRMLLWNEKYGIRFMRLSSEMFPFASHAVHGYKLAPFAAGALAEAGKVATKLGHRLTTHPGQYTQLGSPRWEVIQNAIRDLEYHDEMLSLLRLPEQQDRDAVMVLHLGGTFGDKEETIERFKKNYKGLSTPIKKRLVLENDDVSWSVHDLLPVCEELNIPLVLDFHHHNIIFDASQVREGTNDIVALFPRIKATWDRKRMRQKMHYSEPRPEAVTARQRRRHNPRPSSLPPCPDDMDLMIEAKDKEQAVFELMRTFKLPGWNRFADVIPYEREDDNRAEPKKGGRERKMRKQVASHNGDIGNIASFGEGRVGNEVIESEIGMGGRENRVYWPPGMEEWLRPKKREVRRKEEGPI